MVTLTSKQIINGLKALGYQNLKYLFLTDEKYALIDDDKADDFFYTIAKESQRILGNWEPNKTDCDKFARLVQSIGAIGHSRQSTTDTGLALGTYAFVQDSGGGHAVNILLTAEKNTTNMRVRIFEPQDGKELYLSDFEKNNIIFILF